jgi:hypothetical protein
MSKPKTGTMTDAQILFSVKDKVAQEHHVSWAIPDVWTDEDYLELIKLARQQGFNSCKAQVCILLEALKNDEKFKISNGLIKVIQGLGDDE